MGEKHNITAPGYNSCTGCGVCAIICPQKCIAIKMNSLGFFEPYIDELKCKKCGICTEICYKFLLDDSIISKDIFENKKVIAVVNNYFDQLHTVTSAGVSSRLSSYFFKKGYNVYGVVFDSVKDECKHIVAQNYDDIEKFKNSKYIQSYTIEALRSLDGEKKTIVFGTPCQIYGIRKYIQKKKIEEKFILVDLFCRGIPSLNLWKAYKSFIQRIFRLADFKEVKFRDKSSGWHKFSMKLVDSFGKEYKQTFYNDLFYSFYLKNVCMNKSCYDCKLRHDIVSSDIRLGDFWGEKYRQHEDGVSLVVLLTETGKKTWNQVESFFRHEECETSDIFKSQKIDRIPLKNKYKEILYSLASGDNLEDIHSAYGLNSQLIK